jgi:hypothetical protein
VRFRWVTAVAVATTGILFAAVVLAVALTPDRTITFVDQRSGMALTMQTDPAAGDAGRFSFRVPDIGVYTGGAGADMRVLAPTSIVVDYSGPAVLRPLTDGAGNAGGAVQAPTPVTIRLQAQLDPAHRTAEATLIEGSRRSHMVVASAGRGEFLQALRDFETAMAADDPAALYALMNSDIRAANASSEFVRTWREQESRLGRVTALRRTTISDITTDALGVTFAVVTYAATVTSPAGVPTIHSYDARFVLQSDGWKLWYTSPR